MKKFFTLVLMLATVLSCHAQKVDNSTVPSLDVQKYLGRWYEIARFNHSFERDVQYATAMYTMKPDGTVRVVNNGIREGKDKTSIGKAKLTATPGLLRVSFFGPFYSDYRVMMIDSDYRYALVGSKSSKYLWILSRTPQVPVEDMRGIINEAIRRGYDTSGLIWVEQPGSQYFKSAQP